jgi:uncharacterized protein with HEPN domain
MRNHRLYLKDILEAMESIERFVEGMDFDEFIQDDKTASAVLQYPNAKQKAFRCQTSRI